MSNSSKDQERTYFGGVDPGTYGCLAIYSPPTKESFKDGELHLFDLKEVKGLKSQAKGMSPGMLTSQLKVFIEFYGVPALTLVEQPASMPGQGVVSMFTFGKACGMIEGILWGVGMPFVGTVPAVWKTQMGLNRQKHYSIDKAEELFKDVKICHPMGRDAFRSPARFADGRAEAALLAWLIAHKIGKVER